MSHENYVRSVEDEALMEETRRQANLERTEENKRFEMREALLKRKEALEKQIQEIDIKIADLG